MATTRNRNRPRRGPSRDREPRYVAPVLDPNWQNPYAPSADERAANVRAVRSFVWRQRVPGAVVVGALSLAFVVAAFWSPFFVIGAVVVAGLFIWDSWRAIARTVRRSETLASAMLPVLRAGGTSTDRLRLATIVERLAATFGVDGLDAVVVDDATYNAALVPNGKKFTLFVTTGILHDFDLIAVEGVVAHCMARHRLGVLERQSVAASETLSAERAARLAGVGQCYRADEVAAAIIRYPLGLADALQKCAAQRPSKDSFFSSAQFSAWRWVFFNPHSDRPAPQLDDLDDPTLRAMALEEW